MNKPITDTSKFSRGFDMLPDDRLPIQTVTEVVNIRQVKQVTINDPLIADEYYTLAPRKPLTEKDNHD